MTSIIAFDTRIVMEKIQELRLILKEKISSKSITQISLAKATGVDQATISRFYKHGEGVSAENFIRLVEAVGGKILLPGDKMAVDRDTNHEIERLKDKVEFLTSQNVVLNKLINKYEADEQEKNKNIQEEARAHRPIPAAEDQAGTGI